MGAIASQITTLAIVCSNVYSAADHRKHQSSASLAFVPGIHRRPVNSPHKWPVTRKMFPFDDAIVDMYNFVVISRCWWPSTVCFYDICNQNNGQVNVTYTVYSTRLWSVNVSPQTDNTFHDDVMKWKHFPRYWPFVQGIPRSPVNSPHKGQWRGALMLSLICVGINDWVNNRDAGDLRRDRAHYDVTLMPHYLLNHCSGNPPVTGWFPSQRARKGTFTLVRTRVLHRVRFFMKCGWTLALFKVYGPYFKKIGWVRIKGLGRDQCKHFW